MKAVLPHPLIPSPGRGRIEEVTTVFRGLILSSRRTSLRSFRLVRESVEPVVEVLRLFRLELFLEVLFS